MGRADRVNSPISLSRASLLTPYLEFLETRGAPVERLLQRGNLPACIRDNPDAFVPTQCVGAFIDLAGRSQGIENFGLCVALKAGTRAIHTPILQMLVTSPTLYEALQRACTAAHHQTTQLRLWLVDRGDTLYFCYQSGVPWKLNGKLELVWMSLGVLESVVRLFLGSGHHPPAMGVPATGNISSYVREHFPNTRFMSVTGNEMDSWIAIPRRLLSTPPVGRVSTSTSLTPIQAQTEPSRNLAGALQLLLQTYLADGTPTVEWAAELADMSVRTLQRRLASQQLSFSQILERARFEVAREMLRDSHYKIVDIAHEAGYSDQAHFTRAFRRMAGMTPREFQQFLA